MPRRRAFRASKLPWVRLTLVLFSPLLAINLAVAVVGQSLVFPLSPFFLEQKVEALKLFAQHLPGCLLRGHGNLQLLIDDAERRHGLPAGLLAALVEIESESRVHRISAAGAMGPGQLLPGTARMLKVADPFDPAPAVDASARYLARQLARYKDVRLALAAYNAGPGNVKDRVPRNGETEYYVEKVVAEYRRRGGKLEPGGAPRAAAGSRPLPKGRRGSPGR